MMTPETPAHDSGGGFRFHQLTFLNWHTPVLIRPDDISEPAATTHISEPDALSASHRFSDSDTSVDAAHSLKPLASPPMFDDVIMELFAGRGMRFDKVCPPADAVARRAFEEYGALFVACEKVRVPERCVFENERQVTDFQTRAGIARAMFNDVEIELQPAALQNLLAARREAESLGLSVTPRGGSEAARRSYDDTLRLWSSRVLPALDFWCACGRVSGDEADVVRALPVAAQVAAVLEMEEREIYFSKDFKKSVMRSVALPGTSQHLAMLAFDVVEFRDASVRAVLARHGWFQTVLSDLPHFTFLGRAEKELSTLGLKRVVADEQTFYVPRV